MPQDLMAASPVAEPALSFEAGRDWYAGAGGTRS